MAANNMWYGIELEGPDKGTPTLFIGNGIINLDKLEKTIKERKITRIYFGAKETFILPVNYIEIIKCADSICATMRYIYETNRVSFLQYFLPAVIRDRLYIVLVINTTNVDVVKLMGKESLYWYELDNPIETKLNDPEYKKDEEID